MKVKVSLIGLADMLKFKHLKDNRLKAIDETEIKPIQRHKINDLADYYHPKKQYLVLDKIVDENETTKSFLFKPDESMGTKKLAYFKSGSYVSLYVGIGDSIEEAEANCERALAHVRCDAVFVRHDIGTRELVQRRVDHMKALRSA